MDIGRRSGSQSKVRFDGVGIEVAECFYYLLQVLPAGRFLVPDDIDVGFSHGFMTNDDGNLIFYSDADMQWVGRMYLMSYEGAGLDKPDIMVLAFDMDHVLCRSYLF